VKSFRLFAAICTVALSVAGAMQAANAAATTYRLTFRASGFQPFLGVNTNAPVDPVIGTIFITLDPTVEYNSAKSVTATLNIKTVNPFIFSYFPASTGLGGELGVCSPDPECSPGAPGFVFEIVFHDFPNAVFAGGADDSNPSGTWGTRTVSVACGKVRYRCEHRECHPLSRLGPCP
jgi:hypothetical protein